jgi:hypothetical protein
MSFADTFYKDEKSGIGMKAGDVYRMNNWGAFGDCVILGFDGKGNVKVSRPYLYASSVGTTCATPLLGCETWEMPAANLVEHYIVVEKTGSRIT